MYSEKVVKNILNSKEPHKVIVKIDWTQVWKDGFNCNFKYFIDFEVDSGDFYKSFKLHKTNDIVPFDYTLSTNYIQSANTELVEFTEDNFKAYDGIHITKSINLTTYYKLTFINYGESLEEKQLIFPITEAYYNFLLNQVLEILDKMKVNFNEYSNERISS